MNGLTEEVAKLLPSTINRQISGMQDITELRLRDGKNLCVQIMGKDKRLSYVVSHEDIQTIMARASQYSMYACQDSLSKGYLPCGGGARIGVCGDAVKDGDKVIGIKNVRSLVIRIPHEVQRLDCRISDIIRGFDSTLIVSPPSCGKTTLLREMVRNLANFGKNVLLLDERGEVSAPSEGSLYLDVGEYCDVVAYTPKAYAYQSAVRSMNPQIIATDELFGIEEVLAIQDVARAGIKVLATVHGDDIDRVLQSPTYGGLKGVIRYAVLLGNDPTIGSVREVRKL